MRKNEKNRPGSLFRAPGSLFRAPAGRSRAGTASAGASAARPHGGRSFFRIPAALLSILVLCVSGCGRIEPVNQQYNIYMITKSLGTQFWASAVSGANAARSEYNVRLTVLGPDTEEEYDVQNEYIRRAVEDKADAIVFSAISYTENAAPSRCWTSPSRCFRRKRRLTCARPCCNAERLQG